MEEIIKQCFSNDVNTLIQGFKELRDKMTIPSQQNLCRDLLKEYIQEQQQHILPYLCDQQLQVLYTQWLSNFITSNQENKEFIYQNLRNQELIKMLIENEEMKINKILLIFCYNMMKDYKTEYFIFESQFSQLLRHKLHQFFNNQNNELMEWVTYIFSYILSPNQNLKKSFLKYLVINPKIIEYLFQLFQKTIDDKVYPSLIQNFIPPHNDVKEMYCNQYNKIGIQISQEDLEYLKIVFSQNVYTLIEFKLWSLITFMGGFNPSIQDILFNQFVKSLQILQTIQDEEIIAVILRFCSNMVHINKQVWNYLLQNDLIRLLLSFKKMSNYQLREWSVIIVKNLSDSEQIRDYINKL